MLTDDIAKYVDDLKSNFPSIWLVGEGGEFSKSFGQPKGGSLTNWKWIQVSDVLAHYEGCKWVPDEEAAAEGMADLGDLLCQTLNAHLV